ncbi:MAG: SEC-C domain-containing protein [Bacteroidales bacterium]|nr:SEC-C domain-containing protein [Bacteroidales bacterium]
MEQRSLHTILSAFQKPELQDLGNILGREFSSRLRKSQLVEQLHLYITSEPREWISHLLERDVRLLRDLVRQGPEKVQYQDYAPYPSLLEVTGLVQFDDSDDNFHKVWLSREMFDIVSPEVENVIHSLERNGQFKLERVALGYLNLYGVLPTELFVDNLMRWYDLNIGGSTKRLTRILNTTPIIKMYRYSDKWGDYVCSPCVPDVDELMTRLDNFSGDFANLGNWDAYKAGSGAPYFTMGLGTFEGMRLEQMLKRIGYEGLDLVKAEHDTWMESQFTSGPRPELFDPIFDSPLFGTLDRDALESFCNIMCDYADSLPKWCLAGHSAKETGECLADRDAWRENGDRIQQQDEPDYPRWNMPEPTISDGYAGEMSSDGYPLGLAIPHVAPNDPCPCGSGLRYCRCHGRYMN